MELWPAMADTQKTKQIPGVGHGMRLNNSKNQGRHLHELSGEQGGAARVRNRRTASAKSMAENPPGTLVCLTPPIARGLADAGRAALGMSAASGDHVIASPPRCRAAQLLSPAPPSHPLTASCRTDRAGVCTTYRETYATSAGPTIDEHEFEGPVDKTHHVKRNEMIQVARMQAQMKTLMR